MDGRTPHMKDRAALCIAPIGNKSWLCLYYG